MYCTELMHHYMHDLGKKSVVGPLLPNLHNNSSGYWGICDCRNVSKLPLQFTLKAATPFGVAPSTISLQPNDNAPITISFDPHYRGDSTSHTAKQRCLISYSDNPQKDWLDLAGVIEFPNVTFDTSSIDFGCVLMDSMKRLSIQLSNPGTRSIQYNWSWVKQTLPSSGEGAGEANTDGQVIIVESCDTNAGVPRPLGERPVN